MPFIRDAALDALLNDVNDATRLDICSAEPADYAAVAGVTLGNRSLTVGAPADRSPNGREVEVPATSGGTFTNTGTATHWALTDGAAILYATGALSVSQSVTSGNAFTTAAFKIGVPDAA